MNKFSLIFFSIWLRQKCEFKKKFLSLFFFIELIDKLEKHHSVPHSPEERKKLRYKQKNISELINRKY